MAPVPGEDDCLALLNAAGCEPAVIEHTRAVARLALALAERVPDGAVDAELVRAGALLHDIGRSVTHELDHVIQGVLILRAAGVDEAVVHVVQTHVGAGIDDDEARELGWPVDEPDLYVPTTLEQRIVAHADNLTFGARYGTLEEVVAKYEGRGLGVQARRIRELHAWLGGELGVDPDEVAGSLGA